MEEPTKETIEEWKTEHGRVKRIPIAGIYYYYRPVTLDEYMNIQRLLETDENVSGEKETVVAGLLHPELPKKLPAGLVLALSDEILKLSGFAPDGQPEEL